MRISDWSSDVCSSDVILADDRDQFVLGLAGDFIDLDAALAENLRGLGVHLVGNENFGHFWRPPNCHPRESGDPVLRWGLDSRFRGNDRDRKSTRLNSSH